MPDPVLQGEYGRVAVRRIGTGDPGGGHVLVALAGVSGDGRRLLFPIVLEGPALGRRRIRPGRLHGELLRRSGLLVERFGVSDVDLPSRMLRIPCATRRPRGGVLRVCPLHGGRCPRDIPLPVVRGMGRCPHSVRQGFRVRIRLGQASEGDRGVGIRNPREREDGFSGGHGSSLNDPVRGRPIDRRIIVLIGGIDDVLHRSPLEDILGRLP